MCTLTILRDDHGVRVTMNRDERRDRFEGGLQSQVNAKRKIYYPEDKSSGGTWLGINDSGVILCLLNRYDCVADPEKPSRGEIVPAALSNGSAREVNTWLNKEFDYSRYNPFTLMLVTQFSTLRIDWTGTELLREALSVDSTMATSSSVDTHEVIRYRQNQFLDWQEQGAPEQKKIPSFHFQQDKNDTSCSVLMARDSTHTKSITQITLADTEARIAYFDSELVQSWHQSIADNTGLLALPDTQTIALCIKRLKTA